MEPINQDSKQKNLFAVLLFHNTTIIAIILSLAAMLGTSVQEREQQAYDEEQTVQDRREEVQDDRQTLENDIADLELEYASANDDSTSGMKVPAQAQTTITTKALYLLITKQE